MPPLPNGCKFCNRATGCKGVKDCKAYQEKKKFSDALADGQSRAAGTYVSPATQKRNDKRKAAVKDRAKAAAAAHKERLAKRNKL